MNIFTLLETSARRYPEKGAVFLGDQPLYTFSQLHDRALRLAGGMLADTPPGSRVVVASANCPQYIELLFAVWAAGMTVVPVNYKLHSREMLQIVEDASPSLVFASAAIAAELFPLLVAEEAQAPGCVVIDGPEYRQRATSAPAARTTAAPDSLAWLFYTSGTTGRSKGAMLSHRNLMAMTIAHTADFGPVEADCSLLHAAPMSHGSGLYIPAYVGRGARQVVPVSGGYEVPEFIKLCAVHPNVAAFLAPTMVRRLRIGVEESGARPLNLQAIFYGGGPMYLNELKQSLATLGSIFLQVYGQGEVPMTITGLRRADHATEDEAVLGSVGWPRSGIEVAVFDEQDRPLPAGEIGEIVCRGDIVMSGYWGNPQASADTLRGGWLHTGDVGYLGEDGKLTLCDRSKDVIISGGSNIYPREVEEVLLRHPAIAEVSVIGKADPEWGEIVVAVVVAERNCQPDAAELEQHCLANIARFKRPKQYIFTDQLPKNSYGKVLKRELTALLSAS